MGIASGLRRLSGFCVVLDDRRIKKNRFVLNVSGAALLLGLAALLPEAALAYPVHPSCSYSPSCYTPAAPKTPQLSENPSPDGNYQVTVTNADVYGWLEWSNGASTSTASGTGRLYITGQTAGQYQYRARQCIYTGSSNICGAYSQYSSLITVYSPPAAPTINESISASPCGASPGDGPTLTVNWTPGSGYPSGSTKYYDLQESTYNSGTSTWSSWSTVANDITTTSKTLTGRVELGIYKYRVSSHYTWSGYTSPNSSYDTMATQFTMPECASGAVANLSAVQLNPETSTTSVKVSWTAPAGSVLGYHTQRRKPTETWPPSDPQTGQFHCNSNILFCEFASVERGQVYEYRVRSYKNTVQGPWTVISHTALYATPATPSTPAFSNVVPHDYDLSWNGGGNSNTGTISYKLWEKIDSGNWTNVYSGTGTSWSPTTSRTPTTVYQYKVAACNNNSPQQCTESAVNSISFPGTPGAITLSGIEDFGRDYTLNWTAAGGTVSRYELERSVNGVDWPKILDQNVLFSERDNDIAGTNYQYRVRACNSLACGNYTAAKGYWVPLIPTNLAGTANPATPSLSLTWTGHASAQRYELQQSTNNGQTWGSVISVTGTSHNPASVTNGVDYTYRVRACNLENACSPFTTPVTIRLPYATPGVPAAPTISVNSTAGTLSASWSAVSGVISTYKVEQRIGTGGAWTVVQESSALNYAPSNLTGGLTYYLRVAACNIDGCSSFGTASSAYLPKAAPPLPDLSTGGFIGVIDGVPTYSGGYAGQYTLAWAAATGGIVETINVEEQEPAASWQAASLTAVSCGTGNCVYDKPPNQSGAILVYRYRARACNSDNCSAWKEIAVQMNFYQLPGVPASFTVSQGPTTAGAYTLRWTRPAGTDEVHYYYLDNADTPTNPDFAAIPHDPNQPHFERAFAGGVSGQTYQYRVRACFQDDNGCDVYTAPLAVYIPYPAPNQPGAISHSSLNASAGSYTLNWSAPSGQVDYYELERQVSATQWTPVVSTALTSYGVTAHPNGETHGYRVRACNNDNCGGYSEVHAVYVPYLQPGIPTGLVQQSPDAAGQSFTLAWTAPATGGLVQNYEIQHSTDSGANWQDFGSTANLTLILTGLSNGTNYQYRVRACNVDACGSYSTALTVYLPYAAPGTPAAITHNPGENNPATGAFTAHWTAPATIDSAVAPLSYYQLEYSANGGSTWQAAPTGGAVPGRINVSNPAPNSAASATSSGLAAGAAYSVRVRACNADACSAYTAAYQVYLPRPAPGAPAWLPTNPSALDYQERRFTVQWTVPATGTVHHYQLEAEARLISGVDNWVTIAETPAVSYTFTDRAYGETYRYRVRACSEAQSSPAHCSAWVISGDVRLKYPTPKTPGGIAVGEIDQANGNYNLSWNGVLGWAPAYRYELQENPNNAGWQSLSTALLDPAHEFAITGRATGTYTYRVRACNPLPDNDCSEWSPEASATILPTPSAPTSLSVDNLNGNSCAVNVDWTPPTGGLGAYHYELAVQINGGDWTSLAWTTGTSHNMIVHHDDSGDPHVFRVRARTLNNGQYSLWGAWRTGGTVTTSCAYSTSGYQMNVSAPKFSKTGQYGVGMQYMGTWAPGLRTEYEASADGGANWSRISTANQLSGGASYDASNARATGHYQYRGAVCTHDIGTGYDPDPVQCGATVNGGGFNTVTVFTAVLRDPGSVGTLRIAGLPNPIDGAYITSNGQVTLDWSAAPNVPAPASVEYEIQYKPHHLTSENDWMIWAEQSTVDLQLILPEFGTAFDFRVRACAQLDDYTNCGGWSPLDYPVKQTMGSPRFAVNSYPADGELVIYDKRVPLQWLPPLGMAEGGIHHYEVSIRSLYTDSNGVEHAIGPEVLSTPAPDTIGSTNSNPKVQQATVEVEQGGQKEFLIRACGTPSPTSCGAALVFGITVVVPPEPPAAPSGLAGQVNPDTSAGDPFNGALSGEFSVQPSGAATYTLPILVPPGTASVQPKLGLSYSSQAGNGIAGRGWSIGGLSTISRCNKTEAQDGQARAIDYSSNGAYCLDGQRLIEIGTNSYRTERNDFRRITRMTSGGACSGPWFEVKTQAGETLQYGKTADACIMNTLHHTPANSGLHWALNKVTDVTGNYMLYKYKVPAEFNSLVIERIEYTGRENGALPYTAVEFVYEERPDLSSGYQARVHTSLRKRLAEIRTAAGYYSLSYAGSSDPVPSSRLQSIEYCAFDPGNSSEQCMEPLTFTWHQEEPGWSKLPAALTPPYPFADEYGRDKGARLIDLDADGLPDLIYASPSISAAFRNTGSSWQSWPEARLPTTPVNLRFVDSEGRDKGLRFADLEGDGKPELLDNDGKAYHFTGGWSLGTQVHDLHFVNSGGMDQGLRLADLDGDGKPDLVRGYNYEREVRYTKGSGWGQPGVTFPGNFIQPFNGQTIPSGSELADINGDGLVDVMSVILGNSPDPHRTYMAWLNNGNGWNYIDAWDHGPYYSVAFNVSPEEGDKPEEEGDDIGMRLMDINSDGLPDLVRANPVQHAAYMNTGDRWICCASLPSGLKFVEYNGSDTGMRVADINSDGYPDVLKQGKAWLNPGNWRVENGNYADWPESTAYGLPSSLVKNGAQLLDVDGDGNIDLLYGSPGGGIGAWRSHTSRYQITGVTDGLGNTTEIQYKALTDKSLGGRSRPIYTRTANTLNTPHQQEMIVPMHVVDRVTVNDGIGGELTTEYAYKGLTAAQHGRGIEHFEEITTISPKGEVAVTRYGQAYPYTGMPLQMETRYGENGPLINRTVNEYCYSDSIAAEAAGFESVGPDAPCPAYNDLTSVNDSLFVYVKKTTIQANQLNNQLSGVAASTVTVTRNTYGRYGYLKHSEVTTTGDGHAYRTVTDNVYESDANRHWLGRLTSTTATRTVDNVADINSTRVTQFEYYPNGLLWKEKVEPGAGAPEELHTVHAYDPFGNITETTVCATNFSACAADPNSPNAGSPGRSTTTIYGTQGRYPVTLINALDHAETREYLHPLGLQTKVTGPNGLSTSWQYDPLGRKTAEITPFGPVFGKTTFEYRKTNGGYTPGAKYFVQTNPPADYGTGQAAGAPVRVYYDSLGRKRRTLAQSLHGEYIAADTEYDRFGRVWRESQPYFVYATTAGDAYWTVNFYDALGRATRVEVPLGDIDDDGADNGVAVSTTDYQGFESIVTDPRGRRKLQKTDALGRTVRRVDDLDGLNIPVDYSYDSQGSLTTTRVDNNFATTITITYDKRGNKTSMTDPDMGYWQYQYNGYGELVWQKDAKDQITEIEYDRLGRMIERREQPDRNNDGILESVQTSTWVYDTAPGKGVGKLHIESGPQGLSKTYSYNDPDNLGQLAETVYNAGMSGLMQTFSVAQEYDDFGRVERIRYPQVGGKRLAVDNVYSSFGGLWYVLDAGDPAQGGDESVYWIADMLDARGQVAQETLRNQNVINRSFNGATGWLQKVESWDAELDMIQQTRYGFDSAGNVQYRERFRPWIINPDGSFYAGSSEQVREDFSYDSLDRLLSAAVTRDGVTENAQEYGYTRLGNFIYKDDIADSYTYNNCNAGPHAVCQAKGSSFVYDDNGNMVASTGAKVRSIEYTGSNKPTRITENGHTVDFYYGADDARMFKMAEPNSQGQIEYTWYVGMGPEGGALYEQKALVANGQIVKREHLHFIYAGGYHSGQPFAVHVEEEKEYNNAGQPNLILYSGTEYYHRDHLGSVIAVTDDYGIRGDSSGVHAKLMSFDAFGKRRNHDWSTGGAAPVDQYSPSSRGNLDYTGHEAITEVGLIHMNGRVYDPELGVFLSADPNIQAASLSQNYNRYSYVLNNPIKYNDPSGYFISFVIAAMLAAAEAKLWITMVVMLATTYAETGDLRAAVVSALSAGAANGIGTLFQNATGAAAFFAKAVVHGVTQGIFSEVMGGDFRSGFVGGFIGSLTGPYVPKDVIAGTIVSAMIGGTISELTGGKFRNGARSAAIVHLFNDALHRVKKQVPKIEKGDMNGPKAIVLHRTGGSTAEGAIQQFEASGVGTHYVVDKDGTVYETANLEKSTNHVGKIRSRCMEEGTCLAVDKAKIEKMGWDPKGINDHEIATKSYPDRYPTSSESIGIEVVGAYNPVSKAWDSATQAQLNSVKNLITGLQSKYNLTNADIYRHDDISYKTAGEGAGLGY